MKKYLIAGLIALFLAVPAASRDEAASAKAFLQEKIDAVLGILENAEISDAQKRGKIESIVDPVFDYPLMAKLTLGRKYWPRLSAEEQRVFTDRFTARLKASYFDKITIYSGDMDAGVSYGAARFQGGKVHVPVEVKAGDETIDIAYKLYSSAGDWRIYDVEINGVSIISSYRSQFDQVLSHGSVDDLLEELKRPEAAEQSH